MALPKKTPAILMVTGLTAVVWLTLSETAAVTEVPNKSSRVLNASFIQWKILQRYHPSRNLKHPSVILKLNGESGALMSHGSSSTLPPFSLSSTTTKIRLHSAPYISTVTSKPSALANNLIAGGPQNFFKEGNPATSSSASSSSTSSSVSAESKQQYDEYSDSAQSEEELSPQPSQYSVHQHPDHHPLSPWAGAQRNSVGHPDYHDAEHDNSKPISSSEEDYHPQSESIELPSSSSTTLSPKPFATPRKLNSNAADFNGIVTEFAYKYGSSHELENLAVADDDQISRYFIKTKPKEVSFSVSPILDYTAPTPFALTGASTTSTFSSSPSENPRNSLISSGSSDFSTSTGSPRAGPSNFGFEQTTTTRPNDFDYKNAPYQLSPIPDIPSPVSYNSAVPATSTNYLTSVTDKDSVGVSAHISSVEDGVTPASAVSSTTTDATSIPGTPGIDYPILHEFPYTGFDCQKQRYKGFFADVDTKCQAWHYCDFTDGHSTFLCPNGTLFSQVLLTCDWWFNVDCSQAQQLYVLNERLYRYIKPPKPSFPEDFHGPQVDLWLAQQLQLGLLPKMRKKVKDKVVINN